MAEAEQQIPQVPQEIQILTAFTPVLQPNGELSSPNLGPKINEYSPSEGAMWDAYLQAEPDSNVEGDLARKLATYYLLKTAGVVQDITKTPRDPSLWADRFNEAAIEMYDNVNGTEVSNAAAAELKLFSQVDPRSNVAHVYRLLAGAEASEGTDSETAAEDLSPLRDEMLGRYRKISETVEALPEGPYSAEYVRGVFTEAIKGLAQEDNAWEEWRVTNTPKKTMISVLRNQKEIDVPDGRGPVGSKTELQSLLLHEVGVHAERAVNGEKAGGGLLVEGLPGYLDFEEGLGILMEYLNSGIVPDKVNDRYIDVALASGTVNGVRLTRNELIQLGQEREALRAQARGEEFNAEKSIKAVTDHVNRIFRGGTGQPIVDDDGKVVNQVVFNKDIVYYNGFKDARNYCRAQIKAGVAPKRIFDFLLSGKFDPTNPSHLAYLAERGIWA